MRTKRNTLLLLFILLSQSLCLFAQYDGTDGDSYVKFCDREVIDKSQLECRYDYWVEDSVLEEWRFYEEILLVGNNYTKYMNYPYFRQDSVFSTMDMTRIRSSEYNQVQKDYGIVLTSGFRNYIIKDKKQNRLEVHSNVMLDYYVYEDSTYNIDWTLHDDTLTVCGYLCHKATCSSRGRQWTAWYCDLPVSEGPWKLGGLPGLILAAHDQKKHQMFKATSIRKGGNEILREEYGEFKTTRERFNKALSAYKEDPINGGMGAMVSGATDRFGNPVKPRSRIPYNNLEME